MEDYLTVHESSMEFLKWQELILSLSEVLETVQLLGIAAWVMVEVHTSQPFPWQCADVVLYRWDLICNVLQHHGQAFH